MNKSVQFGIDMVLESKELTSRLSSCNVALVGNPASITCKNTHSLDALLNAGCRVTKAFGPQHGMRGDKQDNMIETEDYFDPARGIPIISLYGAHRRPTEEMLADIDVVLFDLQDVGCRIYTYNALLRYFLEACHKKDIEVWVLDRPNPAGRPVDGLTLEPGHESIVGFDEIITRHGLTVGELAGWMVHKHGFDVPLNVITMHGYDPDAAPGYGWPALERPWVNPSPNASSLNMARCFPGTVLLEGTELSEGRGTTTPLEVIGAPDFPALDVLSHLQASMRPWTEGIFVRHCFFEPTFHKHMKAMCEGFQFHTDMNSYQHHVFKPFRLIAGLLKSLRAVVPEYPIWRHHEYEYEQARLPIDVISGGQSLRSWVDDGSATTDDLDTRIEREANAWLNEREPFLIYQHPSGLPTQAHDKRK